MLISPAKAATAKTVRVAIEGLPVVASSTIITVMASEGPR
jgi:hypothetical protein